MKKTHFHYAFLILIGCCAMQGAGIGIITNCSGLFYVPVCEALGFSTAGLSMYKTLSSISMAFALPIAAKLLRGGRIRMVLSTSTIVVMGTQMLLGLCNSLWQWYIIGILQGFFGAFIMMLPAPILLNNWFHKGSGTAIGFSAAFSGLMGMVCSTLLSTQIPVFGWRVCYFATGLVGMLFILPFSLFVFSYQPADMGMTPYGLDESTQTGESMSSASGGDITLKQLLHQPVFYLAAVMQLMITCAAGFIAMLPTYGKSAGLAVTASGMLTSYALAGNTISKLVFGRIGDKIGGHRAFLLSDTLSLIGFVMLVPYIGLLMPAGAFLCGICMPLYTVMLPLLLREIWPPHHFGTVLSYLQMIGSLLGSFASTTFGAVYDMTGSMRPALLACVLMLAICLACALCIKRMRSSRA